MVGRDFVKAQDQIECGREVQEIAPKVGVHAASRRRVDCGNEYCVPCSAGDEGQEDPEIEGCADRAWVTPLSWQRLGKAK